MRIRVYYEDTDMGGVVYHSNYLNFCERARSELFFSKGASPLFEGGHFVVRHLEADFKKPARLGDLLDVSVEVLEMKSATLVIRQNIFKEGELLFAMTLKLAYLMLDGSIGRLSTEKRERLLSLLQE
jgi:acyl-CoA thioester hydrolase